MKEGAEEGGGPAGVVEGLVAKLPKENSFFAPKFVPGVDGGLDEYGTVNEAIPKLLGLGAWKSKFHDIDR